MRLEDYDIERLKQLVVQYQADDASLARDEKAQENFVKIGTFSPDEHHIALAAIKECVLQEISEGLIGAYNEREQEKAVLPFDGIVPLRSVYAAFGLNQKYELLPLFFNHNLTRNRSIFFDKEPIRDCYFSAYKKLLENDLLALEDTKKQYREDFSLRYTALYPMYDKIMVLTARLS